MTLGNRIRVLRTARNLSQEYLAEQMGVSRQAVYKWEKDLSRPDTDNLIRLSQLLEVSPTYLACGKETQPPETRPSRLPALLRRISLAFFLLALASHCIGFFSGVFTRSLLPVFPYLWYGKSALAIVLNTVSALFTPVWITLLFLSFRAERDK